MAFFGGGRCYPCFELIMSAQGFKDPVDPLACMLRLLCAMASSDLPLGDLLVTNMVLVLY